MITEKFPFVADKQAVPYGTYRSILGDGFIGVGHRDINKRVRVPGKLFLADTYVLYEMAYRAKRLVLEIGARFGRSTSIMAKAIEDAGSKIPLRSIDLGKTAAQTYKTVRNIAPSVNFKLVVGNSSKVISRVGYHPDFVFVDGDHSQRGVSADIKALTPFLWAGTYVYFHDCWDPRNFTGRHPGYGVYQACATLLKAPDWEFVARFGTAALFRKVTDAPHSTPGKNVVNRHDTARSAAG